MSQPIVSLRTNLAVFVALMVLLLATIGLAYADLGRWHLFAALVIAAAKATLVLLFFMHVKYSHPLTWVFSGAALLWLTILLVLTMSDYTSRGWIGIPGK